MVDTIYSAQSIILFRFTKKGCKKGILEVSIENYKLTDIIII